MPPSSHTRRRAHIPNQTQCQAEDVLLEPERGFSHRHLRQVQLPPASPACPPPSVGDFMEGSSTGDSLTISLAMFQREWAHAPGVDRDRGVGESTRCRSDGRAPSVDPGEHAVRKHLSASRTREHDNVDHASEAPTSCDQRGVALIAPGRCAPSRGKRGVHHRPHAKQSVRSGSGSGGCGRLVKSKSYERSVASRSRSVKRESPQLVSMNRRTLENSPT
jgi:hypothetical protein